MEKKNILIIIVIVALGFFLALGLVYIKKNNTNKNDNIEEITLDNYTKSSFSSITNGLNVVIGNNGKYDIDYINDEDFKFVYTIYNIDDYLEVNMNDEEEIGGFRTNIHTFENFYKRFYNTLFDSNKLNQNSIFYQKHKYPVIKGDNIYSSISNYSILYYFDINKLSYDKINNEYIVEYIYNNFDGETEEAIRTEKGIATLKYKLDPTGGRIITSLVIKSK